MGLDTWVREGEYISPTDVSANYTTTKDDIFIRCTTPGITIVLGDSTFGENRVKYIKDSSQRANTSPIIISPYTGTIEGGGSLNLDQNGQCVKVWWDGSTKYEVI